MFRQVLMPYHFLIADRAHQPIRSPCGGIVARAQLHLTANIFPRLRGAGGAVGCLRAQREGALGRRQQARVAVMEGWRLRR